MGWGTQRTQARHDSLLRVDWSCRKEGGEPAGLTETGAGVAGAGPGSRVSSLRAALLWLREGATESQPDSLPCPPPHPGS